MSRQIQSGLPAAATTSLGRNLRRLREERQLPLWKVAHEAAMDSTRLSKIELGQRLPTVEQTAALVRFFGADAEEFESMRIAEKILKDYGHNPEATALALTRIQESAGSNFVNTKRTVVNYRTKAVQKSKKKG